MADTRSQLDRLQPARAYHCAAQRWLASALGVACTVALVVRDQSLATQPVPDAARHQVALPWHEPHWTVNVNQADWTELSLLPGVSQVLSRRLTSARRQQGPFKSLGDLDGIAGIGRKSLESWSGMVEW